MHLINYIARQRKWSEKTFGPGKRTKGLIEHIKLELKEIEQDPLDIIEWVDVIILALDGYWRAGGLDVELDLMDKQDINFKRKWPNVIIEGPPMLHKKE